MKLTVFILALLSSVLAQTCDVDNLGAWTLPPGFKVQPYHDKKIPFARSVALSGNSKLNGPVITYVSAMDWGGSPNSISVLIDSRGIGRSDYQGVLIPSALMGNASLPNGLAWFGNTLWVAALQPGVFMRLYKVDNVDAIALAKRSVTAQELVLVRDDFPPTFMHGWKYLRFDQQGNMYMPFGAADNIALMNGTKTDGSLDSNSNPHVASPFQKTPTSPKFYYSSLYKFPAPVTAATKPIWLGYGIRNTVGFDFHPSTGDLFFTDNGRDNIGGTGSNANVPVTNDSPDCEFDYFGSTKGNFSSPRFFGYPYCHTGPAGNVISNGPFLRGAGIGNNIVDPDTNLGESAMKCNGVAGNFIPAVQALGPHIAPLGMRFLKPISNGNFPTEYNNNALIAQHGSWNRYNGMIGARVMRVVLKTLGSSPSGTGVGKATPFNLNVDNANVVVPRVSQYSPFFVGGVAGDNGSPNGPNPPVSGSASAFLGRPVDVEQLPDGSVLVSDDGKGRVLRIVWCPSSLTYGSKSKLGIGRCGGNPHPRTEDKRSMTASSRSNSLFTTGCNVNVAGLGLGVDTKSFKRCMEWDVTGRGNYLTLAYSLSSVGAPAGKLILSGALVMQDYLSFNDQGWMALGTGADDMLGMNTIIGRPSTGSTGAAVSDFQLGSSACRKLAPSCFIPTTNFVANKTQVTGGIVGNALVQHFSVYVSNTLAKRDGRESEGGGGGKGGLIIGFGDVDKTTGTMLQHWQLSNVAANFAKADVNQPGQPSSPLINPGMSWAQFLAAKASQASPAPYPVDANCVLKGTTYQYCTTNNQAGIPMTQYYSLSPDNTTLSVGIAANVNSLTGTSKGWIAWGYNPTQPGGMIGFLGAFARYCPGCSGGASAAVFQLNGYSTSAFVVPTTNPYQNVQASFEGGQLILTLTTPYTKSFMVNFAAGAYNGGSATGPDGMGQHVTTAAAPKACVRGASLGPVGSCGCL